MVCVYLVMGNAGYDRHHFYFALGRVITEYFISLPIEDFPSIWAQPTMVSTGDCGPFAPVPVNGARQSSHGRRRLQPAQSSLTGGGEAFIHYNRLQFCRENTLISDAANHGILW